MRAESLRGSACWIVSYWWTRKGSSASLSAKAQVIRTMNSERGVHKVHCLIRREHVPSTVFRRAAATCLESAVRTSQPGLLPHFSYLVVFFVQLSKEIRISKSVN
jgi:hypothetical protein